MPREPKPHPEFVDAWRIREVGNRTREQIDLGGRAVITFDDRGGGALHLFGIDAGLDCGYGIRARAKFVEFSWEGLDDDSRISGRGWAHVLPTGGMMGHFFIHRGEDFSFTAVRLRPRTNKRTTH